jgi:hypothetical protein
MVIERGVIPKMIERQAQSDKAKALAQAPVTTTLSQDFSKPLQSSQYGALTSLGKGRSVTLTGDGSVDGYRRVRELQSFYERNGIKPTVELHGAPKGRVLIAGTGK